MSTATRKRKQKKRRSKQLFTVIDGLSGTIKWTSVLKDGDLLVESIPNVLESPTTTPQELPDTREKKEKEITVSRGDCAMEAVVRSLVEYHIQPFLEAVAKENNTGPTEKEIIQKQHEESRQKLLAHYLSQHFH